MRPSLTATMPSEITPLSVMTAPLRKTRSFGVTGGITPGLLPRLRTRRRQRETALGQLGLQPDRFLEGLIGVVVGAERLVGDRQVQVGFGEFRLMRDGLAVKLDRGL